MAARRSTQWRPDATIPHLRWRFQGKTWRAYGDFRGYAEVGGGLEALGTGDRIEAEIRLALRRADLEEQRQACEAGRKEWTVHFRRPLLSPKSESSNTFRLVRRTDPVGDLEVATEDGHPVLPFEVCEDATGYAHGLQAIYGLIISTDACRRVTLAAAFCPECRRVRPFLPASIE